jgi:hypothetical protein
MTVTISKQYMSQLLVGQKLKDAQALLAGDYLINVLKENGKDVQKKEQLSKKVHWQRINVAVEDQQVTEVLFIG